MEDKYRAMEEEARHAEEVQAQAEYERKMKEGGMDDTVKAIVYTDGDRAAGIYPTDVEVDTKIHTDDIDDELREWVRNKLISLYGELLQERPSVWFTDEDEKYAP